MSDERIYLLSRVWGNRDVNVQVLVQGDYIPEKGPAYDHGGLPAEYPIAEVLSVTMNGEDWLPGVDAKTIAEWEQDALDLDYETEYDGGEGDPDPDAEY